MGQNKQEAKTGTVVNATLPHDVHRRLKRYCLDHDLLMKDFIAAAVLKAFGAAERKGK